MYKTWGSCREKELEMVLAMKGTEQQLEGTDDRENETAVGSFSKFLEKRSISLDTQEKVSLEAANGLIMKLKNELEPFRVITDDKTPWEEKSAAVRLSNKMQKHKRNKIWRKRKRQRIGEMLAKVVPATYICISFLFLSLYNCSLSHYEFISQEREQYDKVDQEADEWRAREIAKEIAQHKVIVIF